MTAKETEQCLHCGTETTQRADGKPYCSMDCVTARRREQEQESIVCPYPDCDWVTRYLPENGLSRSVSYREAEEHREEHRAEMAGFVREEGNTE